MTAMPIRHPELVSGPTLARPRRYRIKPPIDSKIDPVRVVPRNQVDFTLPVPALELFLTCYRGWHTAKQFETNKAKDLVSARKAGKGGTTMLMHSVQNVRRHTNIKRSPCLAGEIIDAGLLHGRVTPLHAELVSASIRRTQSIVQAALWALKQVQGDEVER